MPSVNQAIKVPTQSGAVAEVKDDDNGSVLPYVSSPDEPARILIVQATASPYCWYVNEGARWWGWDPPSSCPANPVLKIKVTDGAIRKVSNGGPAWPQVNALPAGTYVTRINIALVRSTIEKIQTRQTCWTIISGGRAWKLCK